MYTQLDSLASQHLSTILSRSTLSLDLPLHPYLVAHSLSAGHTDSTSQRLQPGEVVFLYNYHPAHRFLKLCRVLQGTIRFVGIVLQEQMQTHDRARARYYVAVTL